jgi:hypothetical protein
LCKIPVIFIVCLLKLSFLPASIHQTSVCCHLITNNATFNAHSKNTHRKEQQLSLALFLPSNGDLRFSHVHNHRAKMFEFHSVRRYIYVFKVQHTLDMVIPVLLNILENCTCDEKQKAHKHTHKTHYLKSVSSIFRTDYVHMVGLHVVTYLELATLHLPNKFE